MGIFFGNYMVYYFYLSYENTVHLANVKAWPFITSAIIGCLTGLCLCYMQNKSKTIKFIHFHIMSFGMVILFIGGLILTIKPGWYMQIRDIILLLKTFLMNAFIYLQYLVLVYFLVLLVMPYVTFLFCPTLIYVLKTRQHD